MALPPDPEQRGRPSPGGPPPDEVVPGAAPQAGEQSARGPEYLWGGYAPLGDQGGPRAPGTESPGLGGPPAGYEPQAAGVPPRASVPPGYGGYGPPPGYGPPGGYGSPGYGPPGTYAPPGYGPGYRPPGYPPPPGGAYPPGDWWPEPEERVSRRRRQLAFAAVALILVALVIPAAVAGLREPASPGRTAPALVSGAKNSLVRVAGSAPATFDPALQSDVGTAAVVAQLFEGLTAFDASLEVRPALAESWTFGAGMATITFRLRPGVVFSDGSPLTATDVVDSWFRVLDPQHPSPLASLLDDVTGALAYRQGRGSRGDVGIRAAGDTVIVSLTRPGSFFPAIAANPTLAVVPPSESDELRSGQAPTPFVGSGAYVVQGSDDSALTLHANSHYWAGTPAIATVVVVTDLGGQNPVDAFTAGDVDYVPISDADANWIRYDRTLGPQLRREPSLSVTYYGFDTTRAPFDDVRVRQAFGAAVDWRRIALLADGPDAVATSIVPPGIPGRSSSDYLPGYDPAQARQLLAAAGFPGGRGFPAITLVSSGLTYDEAVVDELRSALGIPVSLEILPFDEYLARLDAGPAAMWSMSWVADYPAQEDFLGLLLRSDSSANYGRWHDTAYDDQLDLAGKDVTEGSSHYAAAQQLIRDQVPVVPVSYGTSWALSRTGLLGATATGIGVPRFAGLAWAP